MRALRVLFCLRLEVFAPDPENVGGKFGRENAKSRR